MRTCLLLFTLCALLPTPARCGGYSTTITNFNRAGDQVARFDVDGNSLDAHDGAIAIFDKTYYLYGTSYACGFVWQQPGAPFCGFKSYSSTDLVHWKDNGFLFDAATPQWQNRCDGNTTGCFRPHVIYNARTGKYVLWFNATDNVSDYHVLTSTSPIGPFTQVADPLLAVNADRPPGGNNGDETLFADDDGRAYIAYTDWATGHGSIVVELLNADYTSGSGHYARTETSATEAPALFKYRGRYYVTYSDPNCGYCGSTGTSYMTADSPLGPWSAGTKISMDSCGGQPSFVSAIPSPSGVSLLYGSDLWNNGNHNEGQANYYWATLNFDRHGEIQPMACEDTVNVPMSVGKAGAYREKPDVDSASGLDGFSLWCDIGGPVQRSQSFVATKTGELTGVTFTTFQSGKPNAGLEVDIYASKNSLPVGSPLSTTIVDASAIAWAPNGVSIHPNVHVDAGQEYAIVLKSSTTSGCYGFAYSDTHPYRQASEAFSANGGVKFTVETNRSARFETAMEYW